MKISEIFEDISRRSFVKGAIASPFISSFIHKSHYAGEVNSEKDKKIKNQKVFSKKFVEKVFEELVKEYKKTNNIDLYEIAKKRNKKIEIPEVKLTFLADEDTVEKAIGYRVDTSKYMINFYDRYNNVIYLAPDSRPDNLVHELVHFIQFKILDINEDFGDVLEKEAVFYQQLRNWDI